VEESEPPAVAGGWSQAFIARRWTQINRPLPQTVLTASRGARRPSRL